MLSPPVSRVEIPWPYSWMTMPFSKSPSRTPGWVEDLWTLAAVPAAALSAAPSARLTLTAGMLTGPAACEPVRMPGAPSATAATTTALAPAAAAALVRTTLLHEPAPVVRPSRTATKPAGAAG